MKKLVIFDVDNTIVKGQSQRLFLSYLRNKKMISIWFYVVVLLWFLAYKFGIAKNPKKVVSFAYSFIQDRSVIDIEKIMNDFIDSSLKQNIFTGAVEEINKFRNGEYVIVLVSNAPSLIIKPLAKILRVDDYFCTELEIRDGKYTGKIDGDIMYGENKKQTIVKYASVNGYSLSDAYAYGDHVSDLYILDVVGHPVAVNPDSGLLKIATDRHWEKKVFNLIR